MSLLRHFNPIWITYCGLIGKDPNGIPNNLLPYATQVALGQLAELQVFGNDYPFDDGTGTRNYIHVMSLAEGHVAALEYIFHNEVIITLSLSTGKGYNVLDMANTFSKVSANGVPYVFSSRKLGDVSVNYAE